MTDQELLKQYAADGSEGAFSELADRHTDLVYSACLRQLNDPGLAEDAAQGVFIALSKKAAALAKRTVISGWLLRAAKFAAFNIIRAEEMRRKHEKEAGNMETGTGDAGGEWGEISPVLDDALTGLNRQNRDVIVLKYFQHKNNAEIGTVLGISEDAARMRVNYALKKLRKVFSRRGITVSSALLTAAVAHNAVQAAPAGLAASCSSAAAASVSGEITGFIKAFQISKGVIKMMIWEKIKVATLVSVCLILLGGSGIAGKYLLEAQAVKTARSGSPSATENADFQGPGFGTGAKPRNLALSHYGAELITDKDLGTAAPLLNDGLWKTNARRGPKTVGVKWPKPMKIGCVVVRTRNKPFPEDCAGLEVWRGGKWEAVKAGTAGYTVSTLRFSFPAVETERVRVVLDQSLPVAEFEAYEEAPYTVAGNVVCEPFESTVKRAKLKAVVVADERPEALNKASATASADGAVLANGFLEAHWKKKPFLHLARVVNRATGEATIFKPASPFEFVAVEGPVDIKTADIKALEVKAKPMTAANFKIDSLKASGDKKQAGLTAHLSAGDRKISFKATLGRKHHYIRMSAELAPGAQPLLVLKVRQGPACRGVSFFRYFKHPSAGKEGTWYYVLPSKDHSAYFLPAKQGGLFMNLEFPHHVMAKPDSGPWYYPGAQVAAGGTLATEPLALGIWCRDGESLPLELGGCDRGAVEWAREYFQHLFPLGPSKGLVTCTDWITTPPPPESPIWKRWGIKLLFDGGWSQLTAKSRAAFAAKVKRYLEHGVFVMPWLGYAGYSKGQTPDGLLLPFCTKECVKAHRDYLAFLLKNKVGAYSSDGNPNGVRSGKCNSREHGHLPGIYSFYPAMKNYLEFIKEVEKAGIKYISDAASGVPGMFHFNMGRWMGDAGMDYSPEFGYASGSLDQRMAVNCKALLANPTPAYRHWQQHGTMANYPHELHGWRRAFIELLGSTGAFWYFTGFYGPPKTSEEDVAFGEKWLKFWREIQEEYLIHSRVIFYPRTWVRGAFSEHQMQSGAYAISHVKGDRGYFMVANHSFAPQTVEMVIDFGEAGGQSLLKRVYPPQNSFIAPPQGPNADPFIKGDVIRLPLAPRAVELYKIGPREFFQADQFIFGAAQLSGADRYIGKWQLKKDGDNVAATTSFPTPADALRCFKQGGGKVKKGVASEQDLPVLMLILTDEAKDPSIGMPPAGLKLTAQLNGKAAEVRPEPRPTMPHSYCIILEEAMPAGKDNELTVTLPDRPGLTLRGAFISVPDKYLR